MTDEVERLTEWLKKGKAGPLSLEIWPTNRCNLNCIMCGTWASRRKSEANGISYDPNNEIKIELQDKRILEIIQESVNMGCERYLITGGGEPFIRKSLVFDIMKIIKDNGLFGNINTNGTLLSKDDIQKIIDIEWDMIMLSVDGHTPQLHDYLRGVSGTFKKVSDTLKNFKMTKEETYSKKPKIVFNTIITNKNYRSIPEILKYSRENGCEDVTFIPLIVYDEQAKAVELSKSEKSEFFNMIPYFIEISKELKINTNLEVIRENFIEDTTSMNQVIIEKIQYSTKGDFKSLSCFEPFLHILVRPNGEVTCCCMMESSKDSIIHKSLENVWYGDTFQEIRNRFLEKDIPNDCKTCFFSQFVRNNKIRSRLLEYEN